MNAGILMWKPSEKHIVKGYHISQFQTINCKIHTYIWYWWTETRNCGNIYQRRHQRSVGKYQTGVLNLFCNLFDVCNISTSDTKLRYYISLISLKTYAVHSEYPYLCLKMEIVTKTCYYLSIQLSHHYSRYAVARKNKTISRQIKSSGLRNEKREFKLFHA